MLRTIVIGTGTERDPRRPDLDVSFSVQADEGDAMSIEAYCDEALVVDLETRALDGLAVIDGRDTADEPGER